MRALAPLLLVLLLSATATAQPVPEPAPEGEPEPAPPPAEQAAPAERPDATDAPAPRGEAADVLVVAAPSETPQPPGVGPEEQPEEAGEGESLPWGFSLSWEQGYNAAGFHQGGQQSFNPEYAWAFGAAFRWNFEDSDFIFRWSQGLSLELTDSDSTVSRQQVLLGDSQLLLSHPFEFELADDRSWSLDPSVGLFAPVSKASQAADIIVATRLGLSATYRYQGWLEGVSGNASFSYTRRWASSNVVSAEQAFPCTPAGREASLDCVHLGTSTTSRDLFVLLFRAGASITEELSAGAAISFGWNLSHPLATVEREIESGTVLQLQDDETHLRTSRVITADIGYSVLPWLSTSAFVRNSFGELGPDGQRRGPFNPVDTVVGTELSVSIDQLYLGSSGDGG